MHLKRKPLLLSTVVLETYNDFDLFLDSTNILETYAFEKFLEFAKCVSEGFLIKKGYPIERIY